MGGGGRGCQHPWCGPASPPTPLWSPKVQSSPSPTPRRTPVHCGEPFPVSLQHTAAQRHAITPHRRALHPFLLACWERGPVEGCSGLMGVAALRSDPLRGTRIHSATYSPLTTAKRLKVPTSQSIRQPGPGLLDRDCAGSRWNTRLQNRPRANVPAVKISRTTG